MKAKVKTVEKLFFACPGCGDDERHEISHFIGGGDRPFGPWRCDACGTKVAGQWCGSDRSVVITSIKQHARETSGYMLLRLAVKSEEPVFFVVKHTLYTDDGQYSVEEEIEHMRSLVDEHTCPTNLVRIPAIIQGRDEDPHGVFEFIAFAHRPDGFDENDACWADLFPQILGEKIIDGEIAYSTLPLRS